MTKFSQEKIDKWAPGHFLPIATISPMPWQELERLLAAKFDEYDSDGLGLARGALFRTERGVQFIVEHLLQGPEYATVIQAKCGTEASENLEQILEATGISASQLSWTCAEVYLQPHEIWRQDDNGGQFFVERRLCRADANRRVEELTARGHKQLYWAKPVA